VYYKSSEDTVMVDDVLCACHNCVVGDSKLNDAYKFCMEISVKLIVFVACI